MGSLSTRRSGKKCPWPLGKSRNQMQISGKNPHSTVFWLVSPSPARCPTAQAVSKKVQWAGPCCHWPVRRLHWALTLIRASVVQRCRRMASSIHAPRQYIHRHIHTCTHTHQILDWKACTGTRTPIRFRRWAVSAVFSFFLFCEWAFFLMTFLAWKPGHMITFLMCVNFVMVCFVLGL